MSSWVFCCITPMCWLVIWLWVTKPCERLMRCHYYSITMPFHQGLSCTGLLQVMHSGNMWRIIGHKLLQLLPSTTMPRSTSIKDWQIMEPFGNSSDIFPQILPFCLCAYDLWNILFKMCMLQLFCYSYEHQFGCVLSVLEEQSCFKLL